MQPAYWVEFNDQWDYSNPDATENKFRALLTASESKPADYRLQLKTQIARALGLQGKFDDAHKVLDEVETEMESGSLVEVRYLLERGRVFHSSKKLEFAMPLFLRASSVAQSLDIDFYTVDALHMLGIAAAPKDQLTWNLKAIDVAHASEDEKARGWLASLYNNTGWSLFDVGRLDEALDLFQKAVPLREAKGQVKETLIAKWCVGKTLRAIGRVTEALDLQKKLLAEDPDEGFVNEEMGECLHALAKHDEAKPYFAKAYETLSKIDWVAEDKARLERILELSK